MSRLIVFFWVAALAAQPAEVRNPRTSASDITQGGKTFRSHCAPCHGFKGDGGRGPNLANGIFYHGSSDADLLRNISDGIEGTEMPGLFYSPDRVWQVVAYIRSLNAGSGPVSVGLEEGARLFKGQGCMQCHRIRGEGGRMGPDLSAIGKTRSLEHLRQALVEPNTDVRERYWVVTAIGMDGTKHEGFLMNEDTYSVQFIDFADRLHSLQKSELKSYRVDKTSKMPSYRGKLTDQQVGQLVSFLSSLRPTGGAQ